MEYIKLNNGTEIPALGIGTFLLQPDEAQSSVLFALQNGYRLIDTANAYMNEKAVGRAIKASGVKRKEIYISTKLWPSVYSNRDKAICETLKRLNTDYIDLLFLHQPVGDYKTAYKAIESAVKQGKVKSIGISNFDGMNIDKLKEILSIAEIKPAVIQVEAHPYYQQEKLKKTVQRFDCKIMAWYPLGHGDQTLLEEKAIAELAKKYGKSVAQIILRWHIQSGNIIIPGSKSEVHIKENMDIFDFSLLPGEMEQINKLEKNQRYYIATKETLDNYLKIAPDFQAQK